MTKTFLADAAERVIATLVVASLGSLTIWMGAGAPGGKTALLAALTPVAVALYDVVKVLLAGIIGNHDSASLTQ